MNRAFRQYYQCPDDFADFRLSGELSAADGFFRLGDDTICFGRAVGITPAGDVRTSLHDVSPHIRIKDSKCFLPFDPDQVVDNLRGERYVSTSSDAAMSLSGRLIRGAYYAVRPLLPVGVRRHFQRAYLRGWDKIPFPTWPVDCSVDQIMATLLTLALQASGLDSIPFIWFWPDRCQSCAIITHDVETEPGRDYCVQLMDIDDSFGIKSSFQFIPESRYELPEDLLSAIRDRGFEINLHGLNHDGHLFATREQFAARARRINDYARAYGAAGFRSPVLYRNQDWFDELKLSYDMSVPNVAHLDPQRGGCCTVMPYLIGDILELPLTTTQDYPLFNVLNAYSIDLWKTQIDLIIRKHGLVSFNIHPDYVAARNARAVYELGDSTGAHTS